ncbi:MAG: phosphatidate cytidylyltransferase [Gemmatimonadales bacterium]|nr:phosphatidate cytidylyltransferase [Gemmatimonadales bacterium]
MSNNLQRILFAVVAIPIAIGVVYWGGWPLAVLVAVIAALGAKEMVSLARHQGLAPLDKHAMVFSVAIPIGVWLTYGGQPIAWGGFAVSSLMPSVWFTLAGTVIWILTATLIRRAPDERPLGVASVTLLVPLYCAVLPSFLLGIRYATGLGRSWEATAAVFFPLAVTWICDTAAMYAGKAIGGAKLAPVVSPGKTRAGSVAGLIAGLVTAVLFNRLVMTPLGYTISDLEAVAFGVILSVAAQIGDLTESLFKREAGVKDSSGLIPGHGGVLDRFDALYFVVPIAAMLYSFFGVI